MTQHSPTCVACGRRCPDGVRFCPGCGHPRADVTAAGPRVTADRDGCAGCRRAEQTGLAFCTTCGRPVVQPPPQPPAQAPEPDPSYAAATLPRALLPPRAAPAVPPVVPPAASSTVPPTDERPAPPTRPTRPTARAVVVGVALVLVLAVGIVVGVLVTGSDRAPGSAADDAAARSDGFIETPGPAVEAVDDVVPTTPAVVPPPTEPGSPVPPAPPAVVCWSGRTAATVDACGAPEGPAGVRWVFTDFPFAAERCSMRAAPEPQNRRDVYACAVDGPVWFNFSQFDTGGAAFDYYDGSASDLGGTSAVAVGELWRWDSVTPAGEHKVSLAYRQNRWGVTVYSYDARAADDAAAQLVRRMRPTTALRGFSR